MDLLKLATAGSVDDGKSTLIGRLLYDTESLTRDKIETIEKISKRNGFDYLDFSLATDGLVAEREQGITIDVAHIYFSTRKRSFVIADTPGHVEYTRNMATGASTSSLSIILIDARKGIVEQTYRHFYITQLLGIKNVIVAINKIDLVNFDETTYNNIVSDFEILAHKSGFPAKKLHFVPISALWGDNVVKHSAQTPWYEGQSLLEILEGVEIDHSSEINSARFPVQYVVRPKIEEFRDYRGFSGQLQNGELRVGDEVQVLPSGRISRIKSIDQFTESVEVLKADEQATITLEDEVNISRGDLIVKKEDAPQQLKEIKAKICWSDAQKLTVGSRYKLQHGINKVQAKIQSIEAVHHPDFSGEADQAQEVKLNEIATVSIRLGQAIFPDKFDESRGNGSFILIDPNTHNTSAVGLIV